MNYLSRSAGISRLEKTTKKKLEPEWTFININNYRYNRKKKTKMIQTAVKNARRMMVKKD